jgi:uncharacterized membrane protein YeaQ/YmgE (transglycosylase-associated protein family)
LLFLPSPACFFVDSLSISHAGNTAATLIRQGTFLQVLRSFCCFSRREITMEGEGVGWIAAIIIGGIAGWLAEKFMHSNMGLLMNIVLGIVGAIVANFILGVLNIHPLVGWLGYLITGFVGACILIALGRLVRR